MARRKLPHADLGIDAATIRALAVEASSDPCSVIAELRAELGERPHVRGLPGHRIRAVLVRRGYLPRSEAA